MQLTREEFKVSTVELIGSGLGSIEKWMSYFEKQARKEAPLIYLICAGLEEIINKKQFDFVFSIKVMEHLKVPHQVLQNIPKLLKTNTHYRFICPNYNFAYEPHCEKRFNSKNKQSPLSRGK